MNRNIKIIGSQDKVTPSNLTPSTRNIQQFISPNPSDTNSVLYFKEGSTKQLEQQQDQFEAWEDKNPSAFIIDTRLSPPIKQEDYLIKIKETVTCPFLRWQDLKDQDEMFDARLLHFDGQLTTVSHLKPQDFDNLYKLAQSIHFHIIPVIQQASDWKIVLPQQPKFLYVEESITDIPPMVTEGRAFLMGQKDSTEKFNLKCYIEPALTA